MFELLSPNIVLPLKVLSDLVISYPKDNCPFEFGVFTFLRNFRPLLLNNKLKKISTQTVHPSFPSAMSKTRLAPPPCQLLSRSSTTSLSHRCPIIQAPDLTLPPFVRRTEVARGSSGIPLESLPPAPPASFPVRGSLSLKGHDQTQPPLFSSTGPSSALPQTCPKTRLKSSLAGQKKKIQYLFHFLPKEPQNCLP